MGTHRKQPLLAEEKLSPDLKPKKKGKRKPRALTGTTASEDIDELIKEFNALDAAAVDHGEVVDQVLPQERPTTTTDDHKPRLQDRRQSPETTTTFGIALGRGRLGEHVIGL